MWVDSSRASAIVIALSLLATPGCGGARGGTLPSGSAGQRVAVGPLSFVSPVPMDAPRTSRGADDIDGTPVTMEAALARTPRLVIAVFSLVRATPWTGNRQQRIINVARALLRDTEGVEMPSLPFDQHDGVISTEARVEVQDRERSGSVIWLRVVMSAHRLGAVLMLADDAWVSRTAATAQLALEPGDRFVPAGDGQWRPDVAWETAWPLTYACRMPSGLAPDDELAHSWTIGDATRRLRARVVDQRTAEQLRDEASAGTGTVEPLILRGRRAYRIHRHDDRGWSESLVWDEHVFSLEGTGAADASASRDAEQFLGSCVPL